MKVYKICQVKPSTMISLKYNSINSRLIRSTKVKIYILITTFPVQAHKNNTWLLAKVKPDQGHDECDM